jgi:sugar phosphate isomerase/epimerase
MKKHQLCIGTGMGFDIPVYQQLKYVIDAGFDTAFANWDRRYYDFEPIAKAADELGIKLQSIHAPFYGMAEIWEDESGESASKIMDELYNCTDDCKKYGVNLMICHTIIGMERCTPTDLGLKRIGELVDYADSKGVTIAFENTEGEEYLKAILDKYGERKNVGFCFDSGHEMCYNAGRDMLANYGKYLICTHLNDNLGMTDKSNKTFLDDCHLLPFDGVADWNKIAERLHKCDYDGTLTFELISTSKPGRHVNDIYKDLTFEQYLREAYSRAEKFRDIFEKTI